jgi:hypothetical protein
MTTWFYRLREKRGAIDSKDMSMNQRMKKIIAQSEERNPKITYRRRRKEEFNLAFNLSQAVTERKVIAKVVKDT